jgi:cell division septation protein DedD
MFFPRPGAGDSMADPQDPGHQENAILQLMVEFRQRWLAEEALKSALSAPAPPAPAKRIRSWAFILLLFATIPSAYLIGQLLEPSSGMSLQFPWAPRGQTATRPATNGTPPPVALPTVAGQEAGASKLSPSIVPQGGPPPAARVAPSAPKISVHRTEQLLGYHVQAGAFNVREYAEDLMHQLRSHDYPATVVDAPTGPPHRVWIDGTFDRLDAERLVSRLRRDGFEAILLPQ